MKKIVIAVIALVVIVGGYIAVKNSSDKPEPTNKKMAASEQSAEPKDENETACKKIIDPDKLKQFSGQSFTYSKEGTGFSGEFSCFYVTNSGPGSHTVDAKIVKDEDKTEFEAAKGAGENVKDAPEFGEAYYSNTKYQESDKDPEWSLHVNKNGKTYIIDLYQYKSEEEIKAYIKDIFSRLSTH
jgi:hypothetical protein